jgi:hypothetical protein
MANQEKAVFAFPTIMQYYDPLYYNIVSFANAREAQPLTPKAMFYNTLL